MTWWQMALLAFIVGGLAVLVVSSLRRWRASRVNFEFKEPFEAVEGTTMAGIWTGPIEVNTQIVAEEVIDDENPFWRR